MSFTHQFKRQFCSPSIINVRHTKTYHLLYKDHQDGFFAKAIMVLQHIKLNYITPLKNCNKCKLPKSRFFGWSRLGFCKFLVYFYVLEKNNSPKIYVKTLSSQKKFTDAPATLEILVEGTVVEYQRKLLNHQEKISKQNKRGNCNQNVVVFENSQKKIM